MKYQFRIDGRQAAPVRDAWREAARDAVEAGYAMWSHGDIIIDDNQGAEIARIKET